MRTASRIIAEAEETPAADSGIAPADAPNKFGRGARSPLDFSRTGRVHYAGRSVFSPRLKRPSRLSQTPRWNRITTTGTRPLERVSRPFYLSEVYCHADLLDFPLPSGFRSSVLMGCVWAVILGLSSVGLAADGVPKKKDTSMPLQPKELTWSTSVTPAEAKNRETP